MKNPEVRQKFYSMKCSACGRTPCDPAHIRTYATCREDTEDGILPLCRLHHTMQGQIGWRRFCEKFPNVREVLHIKGWTVLPTGKVERI